MTKWTITVIVFVARKLGCTYKHPFTGKSTYILFLPQLSAEIRVCRDILAAPLFALLPLYSHASGSLLATSVIHPSFNAYSSNCMFAGAVTSLSCLAFLQPLKAFCHRSGGQQGMRDCESYVLWKSANSLLLGTFMCCSFCNSLGSSYNSPTALASGRNL